jgi:hypothetical protein
MYKDTRHIPTGERNALVALYQGTDGDHWTHRLGWLGPAGTECNWHGITCNAPDESPSVTALNLVDNNLNGVLPEALAELTHLDSINVVGNHLSGKLPDALLRKWLSGSLWIVAEPSAFTDMSEVDYENAGTSLLCARDRIVLRSDGTVKLFTKKCSNRTPQDRATYCEVKEGQVFGDAFGTLAVLLERNHFFSLHHEYSRSVTDSGIASVRAVRGGASHEVVEIAGGSPYEFWIIVGYLQGMMTSVDWQKTSSVPQCPLWDKGRIP